MWRSPHSRAALDPRLRPAGLPAPPRGRTRTDSQQHHRHRRRHLGLTSGARDGAVGQGPGHGAARHRRRARSGLRGRHGRCGSAGSGTTGTGGFLAATRRSRAWSAPRRAGAEGRRHDGPSGGRSPGVPGAGRTRVTGRLSPADRSHTPGRGPTTYLRYVTRSGGATRGFPPLPPLAGADTGTNEAVRDPVTRRTGETRPERGCGRTAFPYVAPGRFPYVTPGRGTAPAASWRGPCPACPGRRCSG
ncbi:hypothetical protein JOC24_000500 [Streptomyces sp. HB132]|nr:hypothetical protein [Streptomyces sp. HB132]